MKKHAAILTLAIIMLFLFAACGTNDETDTSHANGNGADTSNRTTPQEGYSEPTEQSSPEVGSGILQKLPSLGFSVVFPDSWEDRFGLVEHYFERDSGIVHLVEVYHIATREELYILYGLEHGGRLISLGRVVGEHFTYDYAPIMAGGTMFLSRTGGYTYFVNFPSGVEHNENPDSKIAAEYLEMIGHWEPSHFDFLRNSFRLMD